MVSRAEVAVDLLADSHLGCGVSPDASPSASGLSFASGGQGRASKGSVAHTGGYLATREAQRWQGRSGRGIDGVGPEHPGSKSASARRWLMAAGHALGMTRESEEPDLGGRAVGWVLQTSCRVPFAQRFCLASAACVLRTR